jgi:hypothetical protein
MAGAPELSALFREIAHSLPLYQARLDQSYLANLEAAAGWITSLKETGRESLARELAPSRAIAQETTIQVDLRTLHASERGLHASIMNSTFARRYARQTTGAQRIQITIHAIPFPPGTDPRIGEKKGSTRE